MIEEEAIAESAAQHDEEHAAENSKLDKMFRFLENYSRVQESNNLKGQEIIMAHKKS